MASYDEVVFQSALRERAAGDCVTPRDVAAAYELAAPHFRDLFVTDDPGSESQAQEFLMNHLVPALESKVVELGLRVAPRRPNLTLVT